MRGITLCPTWLNSWEMSMILSEPPLPFPPSNFHSPFDGMLRYMISRYSMIALRHIHNPDKQIVLQIFTRNSYFSLDWFSLTWHSFRLLLSITLGQIGISLTIPTILDYVKKVHTWEWIGWFSFFFKKLYQMRNTLQGPNFRLINFGKLCLTLRTASRFTSLVASCATLCYIEFWYTHPPTFYFVD